MHFLAIVLFLQLEILGEFLMYYYLHPIQVQGVAIQQCCIPDVCKLKIKNWLITHQSQCPWLCFFIIFTVSIWFNPIPRGLKYNLFQLLNLSNLWVIGKESSTLSKKMWSWQRKKFLWREMCGNISAVSKHFFGSRQTLLCENKTYNN